MSRIDPNQPIRRIHKATEAIDMLRHGAPVEHVLDQVVRAITGGRYEQWVAAYESDGVSKWRTGE